MELWMRVGQPIETLISDPERIFDAWEKGGVRGLVIGRMAFKSNVEGKHGEATPAFEPNPEVYHAFGVEPPAAPGDRFPDRRAQLGRTLDAAKARGWPVMIFEASAFRGPGGTGNVMLDDVSRRAYLARMQDTLEAFPQADGAIIDGPEWQYEIQPGHRSNLFAALPPEAGATAVEMGYDVAALDSAKKRLEERLHSLDEYSVGEFASGGLLGGLGLFGYDSGLVDWLRFRVDTLTAFVRGVGAHLAKMSPPRKLGMGPRTASFAPLCGYDFGRLSRILDYLLPKHYFWHRGYDGMYGTLARYVQTLVDWNPGLSERSAFAVTKSLFGIEVPGLDSLSAMEDGFPPAFFSEYVADQTRRALAAMRAPERVVPWVDVGRWPHDGDPIGAGDLRRILQASAGAGLKRFLYHNHGHLTPAEWSVISEMCGEKWQGPEKSGYRPPDGLHVLPTLSPARPAKG